MIFSAVYPLVRCLLGCLMVLARGEVSKDAELLVLRHQNAVLRRQVSRVCYQPGGRPRQPRSAGSCSAWRQIIPRGVIGGCTASWSGSAAPIAACTVWQILHDAGIGPAPRRTGPTWKQFLTAPARGILAADFVHMDTVLLRRSYA